MDSISTHPGGNLGANLKSISHRCHPILVAFVWELTKETVHLPLGCLQGGSYALKSPVHLEYPPRGSRSTKLCLIPVIDSGLVSRKVFELPFVTASGEVSRGEKMLYSGTDPESYITKYISK